MNRASVMLVVIAAAALRMAGAAFGQIDQTPQTANGAALTGDADAGAEVYSVECKGCHAASIGPTLRGVINRPVAGVAAFTNYSDALKAKSSLTWTEANLNAFLSAPAEFAPGTMMTKMLSDAQTRADVIAYLASLPPPR